MSVVMSIDDDSDDQNLFEEAIHEINSGVKIVEAKDGNEALSLLRTTLPDHIFVDINMPGMNGLECLKLMRRDTRLKTIPITILSTTFSTDTILTCGEYNAEFICKPSNFYDLKNSLYRVLQVHFTLLK